MKEISFPPEEVKKSKSFLISNIIYHKGIFFKSNLLLNAFTIENKLYIFFSSATSAEKSHIMLVCKFFQLIQ